MSRPRGMAPVTANAWGPPPTATSIASPSPVDSSLSVQTKDSPGSRNSRSVPVPRSIAPQPSVPLFATVHRVLPVWNGSELPFRRVKLRPPVPALYVLESGVSRSPSLLFFGGQTYNSASVGTRGQVSRAGDGVDVVTAGTGAGVRLSTSEVEPRRRLPHPATTTAPSPARS
jgi:hypothetical protein